MDVLLGVLTVYLLMGTGLGSVTILTAIYERAVNKRNDMELVPLTLFVIVIIVAWPLVISEG